jgi:hypothetical protein
MTALDDITLIQKFVQGEVTFLANPNLRFEPALNAIQLLAKKGELIATVKLVGKVRTALVRRESEYWELSHQVLLVNNFMPMGEAEQEGFIQYEQHEIPAGYKMKYTEALSLWRSWWFYSRQTYNHRLQLELLILQRHSWHPIREIVCSQGTLYIKTWVSEVVIQGSHKLVWLTKSQEHSVDQSLTSSKPYLSSHLPTDGSINSENPEPSQAPKQAEKQAFPTHSNRTLTAAEAFHDKALQQKSAGIVQCKSQSSPEVEGAEHSLSPAISAVLKVNRGRLYIQTAVGEIVVEGSNLKFWLNQAKSQEIVQ